jgi:hypothetical protein
VIGYLLLVCAGRYDRPARITAPDWEPEGMARRAVELLATNGDADIDWGGVDAAPGLAASFVRIDIDSNGKLTEKEIRNRIAWHERGSAGLCGKS